MSEGVETVGGAGVKEMVVEFRTRPSEGRDRDGYGGGGGRGGQ